jgi:hypothetical protein
VPDDHLDCECDECFDAALDAALRRPAEAPIPLGFAARTLARAPQRESTVLPYAIAAACVVFVVLAAWAVHTGSLAEAGRMLTDAMRRRSVLAILAALEIAGSLVWLWRAARA